MRIVDYISHFIFCQSRGLRPNKGFPWAQGKLTEGIRTLQIPSVIFLENATSPYRAGHGKRRLFICTSADRYNKSPDRLCKEIAERG